MFFVVSLLLAPPGLDFIYLFFVLFLCNLFVQSTNAIQRHPPLSRARCPPLGFRFLPLPF